MATITLAGNVIHTKGELPAVGSHAQDFTLKSGNLEDITLTSFGNKNKILNIVPSIDTSVCFNSALVFQKSHTSNIVIITISRDTPFALSRACASDKGLVDAIALSDIAHDFGENYNCTIIDGPLCYLLSRAVIVLDGNNVVRYTEQVTEIKQEPDYQAALKSLAT